MKTSREFALMLVGVFGWVLALQILQYALHILTAKMVGRSQPIPFKYRVQQSWYQLICYSIFSLTMIGGLLWELRQHCERYLEPDTTGLGFSDPNPLKERSLSLPACAYAWSPRCQDLSWASMVIGSWFFAGWPHKISAWTKLVYTVEAAFYIEQLFWLLHRSYRHWVWEREKRRYKKTDMGSSPVAAGHRNTENRRTWLPAAAQSEESAGSTNPAATRRRSLGNQWDAPAPPLDGPQRSYSSNATNVKLDPAGSLLVQDGPDPPSLPLTSDHNMLIAHHVVVLVLLTASFLTSYSRIGVVVMLLHDVGDPFLHAAKLCRYLNSLRSGAVVSDDDNRPQAEARRVADHRSRSTAGAAAGKHVSQAPLASAERAMDERLQNMVFVIFAALFFIGRLVLLPRLLWGIWADSETFYPPDLYRELEWTRLVWVAALSPLLVLHLGWFAMILRVIWNALTEGGLREPDEEPLAKQRRSPQQQQQSQDGIAIKFDDDDGSPPSLPQESKEIAIGRSFGDPQPDCREPQLRRW